MKKNNYRNQAYTIMLLSNKPEKVALIEKSLSGLKLNLIDGSKEKSYACLINKAICKCETEFFITIGDKSRPTPREVYKVLDMLCLGFASVQMFCLGFCGWNKDLFRRIGLFDERFSGGGPEHPDILLRMKEANIGYYESTESFYEKKEGSWGNNSYNFFHKKWRSPRFNGEINYDKRILEEMDYSHYDIGEDKGSLFKEYKDSQILTGNMELFNREFIK